MSKRIDNFWRNDTPQAFKSIECKFNVSGTQPKVFIEQEVELLRKGEGGKGGKVFWKQLYWYWKPSQA